jgi:hypothetical protein
MQIPNVDSSASGDTDFLRDTAFIPPTIEDDSNADPNGQPAGPPSVIPPELIAQALGPSFQALFRAVASQRGEHWLLQEFEKQALVLGWTPVLQYLLAKLGNSEQVMLALAVGSTVAIIGGKLAQDAIKPGSSTASTRTPKSAGSSASSASAAAGKPPEPKDLFQEQYD